MKIALTVWEDRISPVFDVADVLMIADIREGAVQHTSRLKIQPAGLSRLVDMLKHKEIAVLVCGAISEVPANILSAAGIRLIPFVSGKIDHILDAFAKGKAIMPAFAMPGVRRGRCRRGQQPSFAVREPVGQDRVGRGRGVNR